LNERELNKNEGKVKLLMLNGARAVTVTQKREHKIIDREKVLCEHQRSYERKMCEFIQQKFSSDFRRNLNWQNFLRFSSQL
jgi:hypothetical protein